MRTDRLQRLLAIAAGLKAPEAPVTAVTPVTAVNAAGCGSTAPVTGSPVTGQKSPQLRVLRPLRVENAGSPNGVFEPVTGSSAVPLDGWTETYEERASIAEHNGGAPR